jgi:hypothetical protein
MADSERERLLRRLQALERQSQRFQAELEQLRAETLRSSGEVPAETKPPEVTPPARPRVEVPPPAKAEHPVPPPVPPVSPARRRLSYADLEFWLGGRGLLLLGILAGVFAVGFFVKEAIERGWIGPTIRVLVGAAVGIVAVVAGERIRARGFRVYGLWLAAGGFSAVYLSIWAADALYSLIPTPLSFTLMVVVVAAAAALGLMRDSESFVSLAAFGRYLAPVLLVVEDPSTLFGLSYLGAISGAALWVSHRARWSYLAAIAVAGGTLMILPGGEGDPHLHALYLAGLMAGAIFVARRRGWPELSFVAVSLGWLAFWAGSGDWDIRGLTFAVYAAVLWLVSLAAIIGVSEWAAAADEAAGTQDARGLDRMLGQGLRELRELLGLGLTLVPPWCFYISAVVGVGDSSYNDYRGEIGLVLGLFLGAIYVAQAALGPEGRRTSGRGWRYGLAFALWLVAPRLLWDDLPLVHAWLVEGVLLAAAGVWMKNVQARAAGLGAFVLASFVLAAVLGSGPDPGPAFFSARALTGLGVILAFAGWAQALDFTEKPGAWETGIRPLLLLVAAVAFLTWGTSEIQRFYALLDDPSRWNLARDLSISGFWMLYAAVLLAVGFGLERPPVRWARLGMALIAAAKVFIYDLSNLDRLYRIGSFVLLAIFLLVLSFRYQKLRSGDQTEP